MTIHKTPIALLLAAFAAAPAFAQGSDKPVDRDIQQQQRIEQGLQSGQLTTREAGRLEKEETKVEKLEAREAADGKLSAHDRKLIDRAQDHVSADIRQQKHDAQTGNPESASSERLQRDVQRDVNQQKRIDQGLDSGRLTTREAGALERGQAHDTHLQAHAAADGHVGAHEQAHLERAETRQSVRIHEKKTNGIAVH